MGDIEKAITYMLKQLEQNPYDYQNANLLGILYDEEDETDKALKYFHLSVAINS
jgi:tetratricopeptide (TPR) repeat protein